MQVWVILASLGSFGALITSLATLFLGRYVANKLMYNDLAHLSADVTEIKEVVHRIGIRQDEHAERIACLEGTVAAKKKKDKKK